MLQGERTGRGRPEARSEWKKGVRSGIPIAMGYLAVSFTFGIAATGLLTPAQAAIMSGVNYTSAGQFAALGLLLSGAPCTELALTQLVINLRYALMAWALSQKLEPGTSLLHRLVLATGVTDEIFGLSACREGRLSPWFTYGTMSAAMPAWVLGTLLGTLSGGLLPAPALRALGVALYGMFLAVVIPAARKSRILAGVVAASMLASLAFDKISLLSRVSAGFRIILLTLLIAGAAAALFPVREPGGEPEQGPEEQGELSRSGGVQ